MPAVGTLPVYQFTIEYSKGGKSFNNILYYFNEAATPSSNGAFNLNEGFKNNIQANLVALISSSVTIVNYSSRRLNSLTDFHTLSINVAGTNPGESVADFVSFKISKIRTSKETRSGWVLIPGVREASTLADGNTLDATDFSVLNTLASGLGTTFTRAGDIFRPILVGNQRDYTVTPPAQNPEDQWIYQDVSSWTPEPLVSSTVSRK